MHNEWYQIRLIQKWKIPAQKCREIKRVGEKRNERKLQRPNNPVANWKWLKS